MEYIYKIKSTGYSSSRYGPCEVCGGHCSEVFSQTKYVRYPISEKTRKELEDLTGKVYGTHIESHRSNCYGHEECLIGLREKTKEAV